MTEQTLVAEGPGLRSAAREKARRLQADGAAVLILDCEAGGLDAPLVVFAALAEGLERHLGQCPLAERFADQMPFDRRLELLDDSLQMADEELHVILETPDQWGGWWRGARRRCDRILRLIERYVRNVEIVGARDDEPLRRALLHLADATLSDTASLHHPHRSAGALASAIVGRLQTGAGRQTLAQLATIGAFRDWHPASQEGLRPEIAALVEVDGDRHRLVRTVRDTLPPSAVTDAKRRHALRVVRSALAKADATHAATRHHLRVEAAALAAGLADGESLQAVGIVGSEHLDLLATTLARTPITAGRAEESAEQAVAADATDLDALRTLAALADDAGRDLSRAEALWRRLVAADPADQEAHEALVSLLLTTADEPAARDHWHLALLDLQAHGETPDPSRLHLPVAATALSRSRTSIAREVLFDVPPHQRLPGWQPLVDVLEGMEAVRRQEDVLPWGEMAPDWWRDGPRRLSTRDPVDDARLVEWVAGRVTDVDLDDKVAVIDGRSVRLADRDGAEPEDHQLILSSSEFAEICGDPVDFEDLLDRYVELGVYASQDGERAVLRVRQRPSPPELPTRRRVSRAWAGSL